MRVLFCITDLEVGGAEKALVEIATRLHASTPDTQEENKKRHFECRVVVLGPPPQAPRDGLIKRLERAGVSTRFLGARSSLAAPRVVVQLAKEIRDFRPAIVQSFLHHANVASAVAAQMAGRRIVVTGIRVAERRQNLHRWLARRTDNFVRQHVCVSQSVAAFAADEMRLDPKKLCVIPNGVDLAPFESAEPWDATESNIGPERKLIAYVGRLDAQKRLDWLIERMPDIAKRLPNHDLILVGDGDERARLMRLANELGVGDRVHFLGWRADVPSILAAAEMLVLCSAWEGMPNVVLEAMAAGLPVVTTRCEGVSELLGENAERQIVAPDATDEFVENVVRFASDAALADRIGEANQASAAERSWDAAASAYVDLYERLATDSAADAS